jgi:hypothetical protein
VVVVATAVLVVVAAVGGVTVVATPSGTVETVVAGIVVVAGPVVCLPGPAMATTTARINTATMSHATACNHAGVDRNRCHGLGGGSTGGTGGLAAAEKTWVGGVSGVAGWATVGAVSGGYQRPSEASHHPGPGG